jgi:glycosyltransferase involved in cell wall biosynthesis
MYEISVVICTYNRSKLLAGALESLVNQSLAHNLYEIIIADNASTNNTKQTVMEFIDKYSDWNLRYIYESNQGLSNARNTGYKSAKAKYVAYIDDDAKADKHWLRNTVKAIEETKPDVLGGPIYPFYLTEKPKWFLDKYEIRSHGDTARFLENDEYISGSNIIFKKQLLHLLGGFDPDLGMKNTKIGYGEEIKLIMEARKRLANIKIYYSPEIIVYHLVPAEKMTMKYFIVSKFKHGVNVENLRGQRNRIIQVIHSSMIILAIIVKRVFIEALSKNKTKYKYYQNYIIESVGPLMLNIGRIYSAIFLRKRVSF